MEDKKQPSGSSSSSSSSTSSSMTLDHLFGPKESSSSSSTTGLFASIFPPPPPVLERERKTQNQVGNGRYANPAEPSYFSSSIYYGGQENYSPRTKPTESHHNVKKERKEEDDPNGRDSNCASRGNWWQGSLYY